MDINEYMHERVARLSNTVSSTSAREVQGIANNMNMKGAGIEEIISALPIDWITKTSLYTQGLPGVNWYATENGMTTLRKVRKGIPLSKVEAQYLELHRDEFAGCPRPDMDFYVYRGSSNRHQSTSLVPFSGTLTAEIAMDYVKKDGFMIEIKVKKHANVMYINRFDQVIFPPESQFITTSPVYIKYWYREDQMDYIPINTYRVEMI